MPNDATPEDRLTHAQNLLATRRLQQATQAFDAAEANGASSSACSWGRWFASMLAGDFEAAWRESDAVRRRAEPDPDRVWNGEPLAGRRVIVRCLHGLGDTVQGMQYAPMLRQLAHTVTFEVPPRMAELAACFVAAGDILTWDDPPPPWDVQIEITELPYIFRTTLADLPVAVRYLSVPSAALARAAAAMGPASRPRVGLVWTGGPWDPGRSIPLSLLRPLFDLAHVELWSLQEGPTTSSAQALPWIGSPDAGTLRDATAICGDGLLPLAATIAQLDLVLTIDTLAAHLAGALGKPVWVMLQHAADWRWMTGRDDSPWYPTLRLFRQPAPGDWPAVVAGVVRALASLREQAPESPAANMLSSPKTA